MAQKYSFHPGELAAQTCAGQSAIANRNLSMLTKTVVPGARSFLEQQYMVVVGVADSAGRPWASILFGRLGFIHSHDGTAVQIDLKESERDPEDPFWFVLTDKSELGMLFIELTTRRRYRVNGTVSRLDKQGLEVGIREAYPNCPKYIQRRRLESIGDIALPSKSSGGMALQDGICSIIDKADTIFVASHHSTSGADASHRGGNPGFVRIIDDKTLLIPEFHGNSLFNTLGNFKIDARAGLCIPDFANSALLQLTGKAEVLWNVSDPTNQTGGTGRFWKFEIQNWTLRSTPRSLEWAFDEASPYIPQPTKVAAK